MKTTNDDTCCGYDNSCSCSACTARDERERAEGERIGREIEQRLEAARAAAVRWEAYKRERRNEARRFRAAVARSGHSVKGRSTSALRCLFYLRADGSVGWL